MNMKVLVPLLIAIIGGTLYLLSKSEGGVSMGGESHDVTGGAEHAPKADKKE